jgi:hypothetical protein
MDPVSLALASWAKHRTQALACGADPICATRESPLHSCPYVLKPRLIKLSAKPHNMPYGNSERSLLKLPPTPQKEARAKQLCQIYGNMLDKVYSTHKPPPTKCC